MCNLYSLIKKKKKRLSNFSVRQLIPLYYRNNVSFESEHHTVVFRNVFDRNIDVRSIKPRIFNKFLFNTDATQCVQSCDIMFSKS